MLYKRRIVTTAAIALSACAQMALSADVQDGSSSARVEPWRSTMTGAGATAEVDPVKTCMAYKSMEAPVKKHKNGPIRFVAKALASELKTDSVDFLKDSVFVFSDKDIDPYDTMPPTNKPYTMLEIQYIDGSQASLIKYPDNSGKIVGGYADGTIIAPTADNTWIVAYPNGVRGKLVKVNGVEYKIYRPDNTITTLKKMASGGFEISNSKTGYMGTAEPDREGMQFEFGTKDF